MRPSDMISKMIDYKAAALMIWIDGPGGGPIVTILQALSLAMSSSSRYLWSYAISMASPMIRRTRRGSGGPPTKESGQPLLI